MFFIASSNYASVQHSYNDMAVWFNSQTNNLSNTKIELIVLACFFILLLLIGYFASQKME